MKQMKEDTYIQPACIESLGVNGFDNRDLF